MTCEECEQILLDSKNSPSHKGWIQGVSVLNLARLHAENCPACAGKMSEIARVNDVLEQVRLSTSQNEPPAAIETKLLAEFRQWRAREVQPLPRNRRWSLLWAPVATFTLVLGFVLYSQFNSRSTGVMTGKVEPDAAQVLLPAPKTQEGLDRAIQYAQPNREGVGSSPKREARMNVSKLRQDHAREKSSLPVSDEFFLNGGGNVVRVTLPLASLAGMGVPIYPEAPDRRVTAEVARDPFGAVIAVRLIETRPGTS